MQRLFEVYSLKGKDILINIGKCLLSKKIIHNTQHTICNQLSIDKVLNDISGFAWVIIVNCCDGFATSSTTRKQL